MAQDEEQKVNEEIEDLTNKWKRALADYQNLEKRVQQEKEEFVKYANGQMLLKILPGLDSLEKAEEHLNDEGLRLAIKQLKDGLIAAGLEKIQTDGEEFNPETMECVEIAEGEDNKVLDEVRPGYILNNKVLRVAQVKVGKEMEKK